MRQSNGVGLALLCGALIGCQSPSSERASLTAAPAEIGTERAIATSSASARKARTEPTPSARPVLVGPRTTAPSNWSACATGYQADGDPARSVARLGLMCGPSNGMVQQPPRSQGPLSESGDEGTFEWRGRAGRCYRLVVAASDVADLEVELIGPDGSSVGLVNSDASWALVPSGDALCVVREGTYAAKMRTHGGRGRYVMDLWRMP